MFGKLASFAAAATLIVATVTPPAHANQKSNGTGLNSATLNGGGLNGGGLNGKNANGRNIQGTSTGTSSFVIDGIELPAAR
ncbi:MAG: hypothetical protein NTV97_29850 [Alphaproteobacteria bacterium]|nr:hypothetical protein [Alphaproteobacteria bacterium]